LTVINIDTIKSLLVFAVPDSVEEIEVMVPQGGKFEFWFHKVENLNLYTKYPV
jgi:hypothetical protein